jgi:flagellum-specific peptidoglycan hydrolase FlgJ
MPYSKAVKEATRKYIKDYGSYLIKAISNTGLYFPAVVAQSAVESGWGKSGLTTQGFNFGGVKYNPNLKGVVGVISRDTTEYIKGKKVSIVQKFSKFKDVESGINGYVNVLLAQRYTKARLDAKSPEEQIKMLVQAGYSTTPPDLYLKGVQSIIDAARDLSGLGRIV